MTIPAQLIDTIFNNPSYCLIQLQDDKGIFANMSRKNYYQSIFTDPPRIKSSSRDRALFYTADLVEANAALKIQPAKTHFIFHTAYCGSTLLSRALDLPGRTLGYREPFALRQLSVDASATDNKNRDMTGWKRLLNLQLILLGRRFSASEAPVIKANVPVNFILPDVLAAFPQHSAILLYSKLENFLASILKSQKRREWAVGVSRQLKGGIRSIEALSDFDPDTGSAPKIAATLWVAQMVKFNEILATSNTIKTLESEQLFDHTEEALFHAAKLFDIEIDATEISTIAHSEMFTKHSKDLSTNYNNNIRKEKLKSIITEFGPEIDEGMQWGARLMEQCRLPLEAPKTLF